MIVELLSIREQNPLTFMAMACLVGFLPVMKQIMLIACVTFSAILLYLAYNLQQLPTVTYDGTETIINDIWAIMPLIK